VPHISNECTHNAHMYFVKLKDINQRSAFIQHLKQKNILSVFHYIPLHSSPAGKKFGVMSGNDNYTTQESERLVRLPMYYQLNDTQVQHVIDTVQSFFN